MLSGLLHSHSGFAYLLFLVASVSLFVGLVTMFAGVKPGLLKLVSVLRVVETAVGGLIGLTGLGVLFVGKYALGVAWVWLGLLVVLIQALLLARGVKPVHNALESGTTDPASVVGRGVALEAIHWMLITGAIALMHVKPF